MYLIKKKICIGIGIILIILIVAGIITNYADSGRVTTGHEPKYCIKVVSHDGSKVTYWGLGYKVIRMLEYLQMNLMKIILVQKWVVGL